MDYILVDINNTEMYQEILNGTVIRYVDLNGITSFNALPIGTICKVLDPKPQQPIWALPNPVEIPAPASVTLSKVDYMNRFTEEELAAIYSAAKSYVSVEVWLEKFRISEFIDLTDPRTIAGLHALEAAGLLGAGRAGEILNA